MRDALRRAYRWLICRDSPDYRDELARSSKWPAVRNAYLKSHPSCAACGGTEMLEVHHKVPVNVDPSKELDEDNLITLCEGPTSNDHFRIGHLDDWKSFNRDVEKDAAAWLHKIIHRP